MALDAQHSRRSKWKHCHRLFHFQHGNFPAIRYAGRLAADPPSNLAQGEAEMFAGVGANSGGRWGDYTRTDVDPSNGMDFWHINEYASGPPGTRASANSISKVEAKARRRHQPLHRLLAVGRLDQACPVPEPAWRVSFSRLTASFTPWAVACPTQQAASSLTRLNTTLAPTVGLQKSATYPDNHVNNMACGVLTDAGTPYIYCVGGSAVTTPDISDRVFRYNPVTDVISPVAAPWPPVMGMVLPGGFTVLQQQALYPGRIRHHHERRASNQPDLGVYSQPGCLGAEEYMSCQFR